MLPVLAVFIDGLRPDSLAHMPFLSGFAHRRRVQTDLGYSITCHATMYSGVHPDKHLLWFAWQHAPYRSPFAWTRVLRPLDPVDNVYLRYACSRLTRLFAHNDSFTGLPFLVNAPLKHWHRFDVAESRMWDAPGYLESYPTIFDLLRSHGVPFSVLGFSGKQSGALDLIRGRKADREAALTYAFVGEVDNYSHKHGQASSETVAKLHEIDDAIRDLYESLAAGGGPPAFLCWSDHGHAEVEGLFDLYRWFEKHGRDLRDHVHLVETNFARFWFRSEEEARRVGELLAGVEGGRVLTADFLAEHHCRMPDNRYGDLIFYLDAPRIFTKTVWGYGKRTRSAHGFLPTMPDMDGAFLSNLPVRAGAARVSLVDLLPSVLSLLKLPLPSYLDGSVLWEASASETSSDATGRGVSSG